MQGLEVEVLADFVEYLSRAGQQGDVDSVGVVVQSLGVAELLPVGIQVQHPVPFFVVVLGPL